LGLARAGAAVAVTARAHEHLDGVVEELAALGATALPVVAEVTDQAAVERMVAQVERELGAVDVLVNNAGSCEAIGPVWEVDPALWWRDVEVSLRGTFLCARALLPLMISRQRGTIINVSGYNAGRPDPYLAGYSAAKAAVVHLTGSLAAETASHGIVVFAIAPGTLATDLTLHLKESPAGKEWLPKFQTIGDDDWVSPELPARLVVRLASGDADALSGRFIHVLDDLDQLIVREEEIRRDDLYTLRLRT
jgi:NAD(P)-dependent dehydrogenase (short-subunit alcohol dehydrogenase family)